jgi:hypothetical protein
MRRFAPKQQARDAAKPLPRGLAGFSRIAQNALALPIAKHSGNGMQEAPEKSRRAGSSVCGVAQERPRLARTMAS